MKREVVAAVLGLCGVASGVRAEEAPQTGVVLPSVEISADAQKGNYSSSSSGAASKADIPLRDIPQSVNVVPSALLKDQNATSMQQALKNVPGVSQDAGDGQRDQFVIRGFSAQNDMYLDGMRDDAYYYRDLSNLDRVEVLKGPSSVLYGRGSAGGLINRVTKKPEADPVQQISIQASTEGQKRTEMDLGGANDSDTVRVRLTGALEDSDGFRDHYFLERQAIAPSVQFNFDADTSLLIQADYLHDKRLADTGIPTLGDRPADVDIGNYYGSRDAEDQNYINTIVRGTTVAFDHSFSDSLSLHSALRAYNANISRKYVTFGAVNATTDQVTMNRRARYKDETGVFWQNELKHQFQTGSFSHEALYGLELGYQKKLDKSLAMLRGVARYDISDPVLVEFPEFPGNSPRDADSQTRVDIAGLYLQDLITLTPEWKLMVGGRFDHMVTRFEDEAGSQVDLNRIDNTFSPRVGIVYQPIDWMSLYASYSRSFQPMADDGDLRQDSDKMEPSETVNKEIGAKFDLSERMSATVSIFDMTRTGIVMEDPNDPDFSVDAGTQRTRGLEVSVTGDLGAGWSTYAGYAWMKGELVDSPDTSIEGNTSALTPKNSGSVWLKKELGGNFFVAAGARYESARYTSPTNQVKLDSYTTAELGGGYRGEHYDLTLNIENLFNREYFVAAKGGSDTVNYPGAPRTATLRMDYRF